MVLILGDPPKTGWGKIGENIFKYFQRQKKDVIYLSINPSISIEKVGGIIDKYNVDTILMIQDIDPLLANIIKYIIPVYLGKVYLWYLLDNFPFPDSFRKYYKYIEIISGTQLTKMILKTGNVQSDYIPFPISISFYPTYSKKLKKQLNIPDNNYVFGAVNNNIERKRLMDIIYSFNAIHKKNPYTTLVLKTNDLTDKYGGYKLSNQLGEGIITITQRLSDIELNVLYNCIDCHINISSAEGLGLSTYESMQCGCSQIISETGGMIEGVLNYPLPKIIIPTKANRMGTYCLENFIDNRDLIKAMLEMLELKVKVNSRLEGYNFIRKFYNVDSIGEKLLKKLGEK